MTDSSETEDFDYELLLTKKEVKTIVESLKAKSKRLERLMNRHLRGVAIHEAQVKRDHIHQLVDEILSQTYTQSHKEEINE